MHSLYNRVAGQNSARWAALSDGIFAVSMTLLASPSHLLDERDDKWNLPGRPADTAQPVRPRRPQPRLDSHRIAVRHPADAPRFCWGLSRGKVRRFTLPSAFDFYVRSYNMGAVLR
jgi:hypothetical protein